MCADCPVGKTTDGTGLTGPSDCGCRPSTYFDSNRWSCVVCGEGMNCDGFDAHPRAAPGYQLSECGRDLCVFECHRDILRCPGGGLHHCVTGRTGLACADCEAGKRPASNGACYACSNEDASFVWVVPMFFFAFCGALYYKNLRAVRSSSTSICLICSATGQHALIMLQILAAISSMYIGWSSPGKQVFQSFSVLLFDTDWIPLYCAGNFNVESRYILRCMIAPCCIGFLVLIHMVCVIYRYCYNFWGEGPQRRSLRSHCRKHLNLFVSNCDFVMMFLFSIASSFLSPFRCQVNPNGLWTMVEYESQICWQNYDHRKLIMVASTLLLFPLGFFAYILLVLRRLSSRLAAGDVHYLRAHDFMFAKIRPQRLWFAFVIVLRNLGFAIVLVLPEKQWQAFTMEAIIVSYGLVVLEAEPWRFSVLHMLDAILVLGFLVVFAYVFTRVSADGSIETAAVVAIGSLGFSLVGVLSWQLKRHFMRSARTFRFYLCYHKHSAGATARLIQMYYCQITSRGRHTVFLSADHPSRLDAQLRWIQNDTRTFLAFLTSQMFNDPWCLAEITTAVTHTVRTRLLYLPSFECPDMATIAVIIASDYDSILTRHGIRVTEVKRSVSHLLTLFATGVDKPVCLKHLDTSLDARAPLQRVRSSMNRDWSPTSIVPRPSFGRLLSNRTHVHHADVTGVLLHDGMVEESLVSALLLKHFLRICLLSERTTMHFKLLDLKLGLPDEIVSLEDVVLLACFTHGCFRSNEFILGLIMCSVLPSIVAVLPIMIPDNFQYPTKETYQILVDDVASFCGHAGLPSSLLPETLNRVKDFTKSIMNNTASSFSVNRDQAMLTMQTKAIWRRIVPALRQKDAIATTDAQQELFRWISTEGYKTLQREPNVAPHTSLGMLEAKSSCYESENSLS